VAGLNKPYDLEGFEFVVWKSFRAVLSIFADSLRNQHIDCLSH